MRHSFSKRKIALPLPNLISIQHDSFNWLSTDGLKEVLDELGTVEDNSGRGWVLKFSDHDIQKENISVEEAKRNGRTYDAPWYVKATLEDPINKIAELITNWKAMGTLAIVSAIIIIIIQILKTKLVGGWFGKRSPLMKRAILVILGQISGIVLMVLGGIDWIPAIMTGLVTSGGAMSIYEVIKPFFAKKA